MVPILRLCFLLKSNKPFFRAIVPSSFITSHITADSVNPANLQRSVLPSVCPARDKTPPGKALTGKICPGETISLAFALALEATATVLDRSAEEIPVDIPYAASIETVKPVP